MTLTQKWYFKIDFTKDMFFYAKQSLKVCQSEMRYPVLDRWEYGNEIIRKETNIFVLFSRVTMFWPGAEKSKSQNSWEEKSKRKWKMTSLDHIIWYFLLILAISNGSMWKIFIWFLNNSKWLMNWHTNACCKVPI